jgi:UDP-N-acetyl-D-mannosaminuronic acid dehydrogenase
LNQKISPKGIQNRFNQSENDSSVGGHCIAVDPWFIVSSAPERSRISRTAREVNDGKPHWVLDKVAEAVTAWNARNGSIVNRKPKIACYGLAFKPDIDDLRESPALEIAQALVALHPGEVLAVEPNIEALPAAMDGAQLVDFETAAEIADIHVLLVDHRQFKRRPAPGRVVIDTRGVWVA